MAALEVLAVEMPVLTEMEAEPLVRATQLSGLLLLIICMYAV